MKRKITWIVLIVLAIQIFPLHQVAFATPQEKPKNTRIKEIDGQSSIGYDTDPQNLGYYADMEWDAPIFSGTYHYYNIYYKKDGESFKQYGSALPSSITEVHLSKLDSGTVYHAYVNAVHAHSDNDPDYPAQIHSSTAGEEDQITFLTGIDLKVLPASTEEIEIIWDDVKYKNQRIGYRIYIAQSRDFATTSPIEVYPENIGPSGAVKPVEGDKLSYIAKNKKPGTVYYVKVEPIVYDSNIIVCPENKIGIGFTYIPATMTRVSAGTEYDIWKMEWERVTSSVSGTEETEYIIMQQDKGDLWKSIGGQKDVIRYFKVYHGEEERFQYKVRVYIANELDDKGYPLYIESNALSPYISEAPYYPTVPDIRHSIPENIDEKMEIDKDYIKMMWYVPTGPDGKRDTSIYYDFWITTDPTEFNNPDRLPDVTDFQPTQTNYIYEKIGDSLTDYIVAYKYTFEELEPNTVYYIKMVAKKKFWLNAEGELKQVYYESDPAIEMVLTDSDNINVPTAPAKPPFTVKKDTEGNPIVTDTTAAVEWKTGWYEIRDENTGEWIYYNAQEHGDSVADYVYREIQYDKDVKFGIGYIQLTDDMDDYSVIRDMPLQIMGISNLYEDSHGIMEHTLTDLEPNKMYIVWLRAYRDTNKLSEPSNPVVITTDFDYTVPLEKPAVPKWIKKYCLALENNEGIQLAWDRTTERYGLEYTYYLKWATEDNINVTIGETEIPSTYFDMTDVYMVEDLDPETPYYFWISVEVKNDKGESEISDWSDSKLIKTTKYVAPDTPTGFGVKNTPDAIGKDYITYEWNMEADMDYILEFADNPEYKNPQTFDISAEGEYKVENLSSNARYYARLYAVDRERQLRSYPTHTVSVKTLRSDDEYDTGEDNEKVIEGPFIEDSYDRSEGEWCQEIIGINADRFLETIYTDYFLDYVIDMNDPPSSYKKIASRKVRIAYKVFNSLSQAKENLIIDIGDETRFVIRPYMLEVGQLSKIFDTSKEIIVEFIFRNAVSTSEIYQLNVYPTKIVQVDLEMKQGNTIMPITRLNRPLKATMNYKNSSWYYGYQEQVKAAVIETNTMGAKWSILPSTFIADSMESEGVVSFETTQLGKLGIIRQINATRFIDISNHWAARDISSIFLKYNIRSIPETEVRFYPDYYMTVDDCTKFILDVLEVDYTSENYLKIAFKAGLMELVNAKQDISRQEATAMLVRVYEIKMGETAEDADVDITQYYDASEIGEEYQKIFQFAAQEGFIIGKTDTILAPTEPVTRAEVIAMLRRLLQAIGEME